MEITQSINWNSLVSHLNSILLRTINFIKWSYILMKLHTKGSFICKSEEFANWGNIFRRCQCKLHYCACSFLELRLPNWGFFAAKGSKDWNCVFVAIERLRGSIIDLHILILECDLKQFRHILALSMAETLKCQTD